jgi:hypothetical protein
MPAVYGLESSPRNLKTGGKISVDAVRMPYSKARKAICGQDAHWHTYARHNRRRIGRVLIGCGRDVGDASYHHGVRSTVNIFSRILG